MHHGVGVTHAFLAIVAVVHRLADAALFQFDFKAFAERLLSIYLLNRHRCVVCSLVTDKAVSFGAPTRLVSHNSHGQNYATVLLAEEIKQIHIGPLIRQVEDKKIGSGRPLLILARLDAVQGLFPLL